MTKRKPGEIEDRQSKSSKSNNPTHQTSGKTGTTHGLNISAQAGAPQVVGTIAEDMKKEPSPSQAVQSKTSENRVPEPNTPTLSKASEDIDSPTPPKATDDEITEQELAAGLRRKNGEFTLEEQVLLDEWSNAASYGDLIDLNRQYLRGELPFTCYHLGLLFPETTSLVPALLRLHDYGMLTLESQPVETTEDIVKATCGCISWVKEQQIPFLTFLLPQNCGHIDPTQLNKFLVELMIDDGMYASILTFENRCNTSRACFVKPKVVSSFPEDWCTHFYQSAKAVQDFDSPAAATDKRKQIDPNCACCIKAFGREETVLDTVKPLVINVLAKRWDEEDLVGKVEKIATRVGMEKVYADGIVEMDDLRGDGGVD